MSPAEVEGFALSPDQRRIWRLRGAGCDSFVAASIALSEGIDRQRLLGALDAVIRYNSILRTAFHELPGLQCPVQVPMDWIKGAARIENDAADRHFHLGGGRVLSSRWVEDARGRSLSLAIHAMCADDRTIIELLQQLAAAYDGRLTGVEALPYAQVAAWQNGLVTREGASNSQPWRGRDLTGVREMTLPFARPSSNDASSAAMSTPHTLSDDVVAGLCSIASTCATPLATVLLAAWHAVLRRLTGTSEVAIGDTYDARSHELLKGALGPLTRQVPVLHSMQEGDSLTQMTRRLARVREEAHMGGDEFLWDENFAFAFRFDAYHSRHPVSDGELTLTHRQRSFDRNLVCLCVDQNECGLSLQLQFDEGRLSAVDAARVSRYVSTFVSAAARSPHLPIQKLPLLDADERHWLLEQLNATATPLPPHRSWCEWFRETAMTRADALAVVFGTQTLSFRELERKSNQLAHALQGYCCSPEARIGVLLERSLDALVAILGIWKAGAVYVPLDPRRTSSALTVIIDNAALALVLTSGRLGLALEGIQTPWVAVEDIALEQYPESPPACETSDESLAYILHTSGSVSAPKAVMVCHGALVNLLQALSRTVYEGVRVSRVSLNAPLTFDASIKQILTLALGTTLVVIPEEARADAAALLTHLHAQAVDVFDCTPFQFRQLLAANWHAHDARRPAYVLLGGECVDRELLRQLQADSRTTFFNLYGPTECTVDVAVARLTAEHTEPVVGKPLANVRVYVLDDALQPVPRGVTGEICVAGRGLARGYFRRPDLTAHSFVPDPFATDGTRLYRTGDLGRHQPDGSLQVLGRRDRQVKVSGVRIELSEIEEVLRRQPGVREAAVVCEESARDTRVIAYCVLAASEAATIGKLRERLRESLPEYMVPAKLIPVSRLPQSAHGKLDQSALAALALSADPDLERPYVAPESEVSRAIAAIWSQELGVPRVSLHDNFFDLGGHSLLMARIHARLRSHFAREISLIELFRHPTVERLAAYFANGEPAQVAAFGQARERAAQRQRRATRSRRTHDA